MWIDEEETRRILNMLSGIFPKSTEEQELKRWADKETISDLRKYLVYLEDKNWIKKEVDRFRITGYGIDYLQSQIK